MSKPNRPFPVTDRLSHQEWFGLGALAILFVSIGFITEFRAICQDRPKGDLLVFLRTAWAVRAGHDIYTMTDHNGWHYHYPPLLAILLTPLANPPPAVWVPWTVPYSVSVAIWFVLNMALLFAAVHMLAGALEKTTEPATVRWGRRWWAWRVVPIVACLPPIFHTLVRGQVGILLLFLLCGALASFVRNRSRQAGFWLAGAICLKVIPAFLLLYPLWRRDGRCLASCGCGLVVGLVMIPAAVFGPERTVSYYQEWTEALLLPAMAKGNDHVRDGELIDVTATHSQSYLPVLHNWLNLHEERRPTKADTSTRLAHWCLAAILTLATLAAAGRRPETAASTVLFFGVLVLMMILASPICHTHYFVLSIPVVMGLLASLPPSPGEWMDRGLGLLLGMNFFTNAVPLLDGMEPLRDLGLITSMALALWLTACIRLRRLASVAEETEAAGLAA